MSDGFRDQPNDIGAERAVLGAALTSPAAAAELAALIGAEDFYRPAHRTVYEAITGLRDRGSPADAITVADELRRRGQLDKTGGADYLHTLMASVTSVGSAGYHAAIVAKQARLRERIEGLTRALQAAWSPGADPAAVDELLARMTGAATVPGSPSQARELTEFLNADDPEYDWLVPGLLERGDRLILTGAEGGGKSTLLRQLGVQIASGVHPFTGERFPRRRVLLVDAENSEPQTRRKLRPIHIALKGDYDPDPGMYVENRQGGLDLGRADDQQWLIRHVRDKRPELLITGPLYKLIGGDPTSEEAARAVSACIDRLRAEFGITVILEAHTPHAATAKGSKRPERPYGASLWLRWPEFGIYLSPEGFLRHWRGQRDERDWPAMLQRGGHLPWTVATRPRDVLWARIAELCTEAGDQLSQRDLAELLSTSQMSVQRAIGEHRAEWAALAAEPPNHAHESPD